MEDLTDMQNHVLSYLQSFYSLEEKGVKERRGQQISEKRENRVLVKQSTVESKAEINREMRNVSRSIKREVTKASALEKGKKPSIHERLEINERKIQEKQGKDKPKRGANRDVRERKSLMDNRKYGCLLGFVLLRNRLHL